MWPRPWRPCGMRQGHTSVPKHPRLSKASSWPMYVCAHVWVCVTAKGEAFGSSRLEDHVGGHGANVRASRGVRRGLTVGLGQLGWRCCGESKQCRGVAAPCPSAMGKKAIKESYSSPVAMNGSIGSGAPSSSFSSLLPSPPWLGVGVAVPRSGDGVWERC